MFFFLIINVTVTCRQILLYCQPGQITRPYCSVSTLDECEFPEDLALFRVIIFCQWELCSSLASRCDLDPLPLV